MKFSAIAISSLPLLAMMATTNAAPSGRLLGRMHNGGRLGAQQETGEKQVNLLDENEDSRKAKREAICKEAAVVCEGKTMPEGGCTKPERSRDKKRDVFKHGDNPIIGLDALEIDEEEMHFRLGCKCCKPDAEQQEDNNDALLQSATSRHTGGFGDRKEAICNRANFTCSEFLMADPNCTKPELDSRSETIFADMAGEREDYDHPEFGGRSGCFCCDEDGILDLELSATEQAVKDEFCLAADFNCTRVLENQDCARPAKEEFEGEEVHPRHPFSPSNLGEMMGEEDVAGKDDQLLCLCCSRDGEDAEGETQVGEFVSQQLDANSGAWNSNANKMVVFFTIATASWFGVV